MQNKKNERLRVSFSALKWLFYEGATPAHFYKVWTEKSDEKTAAQQKGINLHAALLTPELFAERYYIEPEITLQELNALRAIIGKKPVENVRRNVSGYEFLMHEKLQEIPDYETKTGISASEFDHILKVQKAIHENQDIAPLLSDPSCVFEKKEVCTLNIDGIEFDVSFICDCVNYEKSYEIDIKNKGVDILNEYQIAKAFSENILQRAAYNFLIEQMTGKKIKENYLIVIDDFGLPLIRPYDRSDILAAEVRFYEVLCKFVECVKSNNFHGYLNPRSEFDGKIYPANLSEYMIEKINKPIFEKPRDTSKDKEIIDYLNDFNNYENE